MVPKDWKVSNTLQYKLQEITDILYRNFSEDDSMDRPMELKKKWIDKAVTAAI